MFFDHASVFPRFSSLSPPFLLNVFEFFALQMTQHTRLFCGSSAVRDNAQVIVVVMPPTTLLVIIEFASMLWIGI
jgi:hypothetical protein